MSRKKKKGNHWGSTQIIVIIVAFIAAALGIFAYNRIVNSSADDADYTNAPRITSEAALKEIQPYTGKILVQGNMTGNSTFTFAERYNKVNMLKESEVSGDFIYSELDIRNPETYIQNESDVEKNNATPEYATHWVGLTYKEQAEGLNVYGMPIDAEKLLVVHLKDFGDLYDTTKERATFKAIVGSEAPVVIIGNMENGEFVKGTLYVNGTFDEALSDLKGGSVFFLILLIVWLIICALVIVSMYLQRYDKM